MKHCILVKFIPSVDAARKQVLQPEIEAVFAPTLAIPGVHAVEVIPNCVDRSNRYDLLIRIDMAPEALPAYDASEAHKRWKADYGDLLEKKAIFDYEA